MSSSKEVRVRIAPSPTGDPHVGTAYVGLFNHMFAKKNQGKFILRIEDTDQSRSTADSEKQILDSLKWVGINWDEGPDVGGDYGPYKQSERLGIYKEYIQKLIDNKTAYYCFCTSDRLQEVREKQKANKEQTKYDRHCLSLSDEEIQKNLKAGVSHVVRLRISDEEKSVFKDELRGEIAIDHSQLDDQVLMKSDGYPTYHLASVVDDHLMKITHVIRAEEWISSTPKHVLLYKAFGWEQPAWVHLSLLRNTDKSKISKRKNPVSLNYYRGAGILPQALLNFLALMGWNHEQENEFFNVEDLIAKFDLSQLTVGSPVFDLQKLNWLNQQYIQSMEVSAFKDHVYKELLADDYLDKIFPLLKERLERFEDLFDRGNFFFVGALPYSLEQIILPKGQDKPTLQKTLKALIESLDSISSWNSESIHAAMESCREQLDIKAKFFYMPIRIIQTGRKDSPPLPETLEVLGKDRVRFRFKDCLDRLKLK